MENSVICFCDIDAERPSQANFYNTLYEPDGLQLTCTRKGVALCSQFKGYFYVNLNAFDLCFEKKVVRDYLYFFHLTVPVESYMSKEYIDELNDYTITSNGDALINYLNVHEDDARAWLASYKTPDVLNSKKCK